MRKKKKTAIGKVYIEFKNNVWCSALIFDVDRIKDKNSEKLSSKNTT